METLEGRIIGRNLYERSLRRTGVGCSGHTTVVVDYEDVTSSAGVRILHVHVRNHAHAQRYSSTAGQPLVSDRHVVTKLPRPG